MIFMLDNYDSFTYNIVQYLGELKQKVFVARNDEISIAKIERMKPSHIVISPGPCTPREAGISVEVVRHFSGKIPILGVCLGHQSLGVAFGGKVIRARKLMHGKVSQIKHDRKKLYQGLKPSFSATRYHSLVLEKKNLPKDLMITATSEDGEIMGVRHRRIPCLEGVQFHPESILSEYGRDLLRNFLKMKISRKKPR